MNILFMCTGNICRSPSAEAVLRKMVKDAGLDWKVDSAGLGDWHQGESPDHRARNVAEDYGYDMGGIRARMLRPEDFAQFDRIYAMTEEHRRKLQSRAPSPCHAEICLFMAPSGETEDVPDPYFGGKEGFVMMMNMIEKGCRAIVAAQ